MIVHGISMKAKSCIWIVMEDDKENIEFGCVLQDMALGMN